MKRRTLGLMAGTSVIALVGSNRYARAQQSPPDFGSLSKTSLTPVGAERAGNAAGTIPAWTGGMIDVPSGTSWDPTETMAPDFWADEKALYTIDASNMADHLDRLTVGVQTLIQKQGFSLQVFPTHRTAAYPQWIYDNTLSNSLTAKSNPDGAQLGFSGAYGGFPFPIPDASDPNVAGAQIIWNHSTRWEGSSSKYVNATFAVSNGQILLSSGATVTQYSPYYQQNGNVGSWNGNVIYIDIKFFEPSNNAGGEVLGYYSANPLAQPDVTWQLLQGQGRVRKAPEIAYDTPSQFTNGIANFDDYFGFIGALDEYNWKLTGKREMLIPYNNNKLALTPSGVAHGPKFLNPDAVRWELHRVWVVEATLRPGSRNTAARRVMFVDEDTWRLALSDIYDANGNIYKEIMVPNAVYPNLPGTVILNAIAYNLQTGDYVSINGPWGEAPFNRPWIHNTMQPSDFDPQTMAANASY